MIIFNIEATKKIHKEVWANTREEAIQKFHKENEGFELESVDDKFFVSKCESCSVSLIEDDKYMACEDGIFLCWKCGKDMKDD